MGWGGVSRFHAEKPQTIKEKVPYCLWSIFLPKATAQKASASLGLQGQPAPPQPCPPSPSLMPWGLSPLLESWVSRKLGRMGPQLQGQGHSAEVRVTPLVLYALLAAPEA